MAVKFQNSLTHCSYCLEKPVFITGNIGMFSYRLRSSCEAHRQRALDDCNLDHRVGDYSRK